MDFFQIKQKSKNGGSVEIYPDFKVTRSKDLMVRGRSFYAIWDEEKGLWSTDEYDVQRLVDKELLEYRNKLAPKVDSVIVRFMSDFSTNAWKNFKTYLAQISDNAHQLDEGLTFQNTEVKKTDYVSRRLPYSLEKGKIDAYERLMFTLYSKEERQKLEWAVGAIVAGEAKDIQKFIVLYGEAGSGKSTFLNILQKLFSGYYTTFEAKALTSASNIFSTEVFRNNPLVAIQHDGDLSRIEDNTKLNSLVAHEAMTMNEKYKPSYTARTNSFLFMATNKPVRITEAKSGIIRRLIDVQPTGKRIPINQYHSLMNRLDFELGGIAHHCLEVYREMGKNFYSAYRPLGMIFQTDIFFNFVETNYYFFLEQGGVSLAQAWEMYKQFCEESLIDFKLPKYKFREELKNYFKEYFPITRIDGKQVRNYYSELLLNKFEVKEALPEDVSPGWLVLDNTKSLFDEAATDYPAQYASKYETPSKPWAKVKTTLKNINTTKLHYVQVPENHIVIDFDIRDDKGEKSPELNLQEASKWQPTYGEFSKSGYGIHLHYIWDGDPAELNRIYSEGVEIKVFTGDSALRRKLSKCNNIPIETINSGLPLREKKMINFEAIKNENVLRELIKKNLRKEVHGATKPSIDFIFKILEDAYNSEMNYDVRDMRQSVLSFAMNSTHQAQYCVHLVGKMKFNSEEPSVGTSDYTDERLVFFDVEVFPNLFLISWKYDGEDNACVHMINPTSSDIEGLLKMRLVGFNNRRYDNHILYARYIGYDNERLFKLSSEIINEYKRSLFGEAYSVSYADVYDFSSKKQSLKKFQIELGLLHRELNFPFDQPIPEEHWHLVVDYCDNDVISTEAVFHERKQDFIARKILADLSGLSVNDTTQTHTAKILFGNEPRPQEHFIYTDLSEMFPGYSFESGKSTYRGEDPGEGGYVYAEPGFYKNVVSLDIASMHPSSIVALNLFGFYTDKYKELMDARLAIKHGDYDKLKGTIYEKYLSTTDNPEDLAYALKIALNIVYGLTSASFSNKFRDQRNKDNIVAKRGALFMIDLKNAVQEQGYTVAHIKTDSIKIPNATKKIIKFVVDFGKKYGYTFEEEPTFDKFLLVNDAVYVGRYDLAQIWSAVGAEFAHPYIFKTLFSKEKIEFIDFCETKSVTTYIYLDMNEDLPEGEHNYIFVGKAGSFCPIKPGCGGGVLLRKKDEKYYAITGTKGYRWHQAEVIKTLEREDDIDLTYYQRLVNNAIEHIEKFVDLDTLLN